MGANNFTKKNYDLMHQLYHEFCFNQSSSNLILRWALFETETEIWVINKGDSSQKGFYPMTFIQKKPTNFA